MSTGIYLGYRVAASGEGTWVARIRADDGKQKYHALGTFVDFDAAKARAEEIARAKAPLLRRVNGQRWSKDGWKTTFKTAASLPDDVVLYSLRHAAISEFIAGGKDSFLVARLAGTSTAMIDKHYGHLRHDRTRAAMDAVKMV